MRLRKTVMMMMISGLMGGVCGAAEPPPVALKVGDRTHGFVVRAIEEVPELHARCVRMEYCRNGASLLWLARAEENKTFAIAFRTPPADDTGVAHILEHSVLCGSGRYPVREPFVELLKSSMATYLNASTWPQLTCYPVATRNARDFSNLIGVYLDAVFDPRCVREDWVLKQEGWHAEPTADGSVTRTGVVYSEMKGVFANPDSVAFHELKRLLFPDNCFGYISGGDPAHIPELTFEAFKAFYHTYYHPSNARIFLDGDIDLETVLPQLDDYLGRYAPAAICSQIPLQAPVARRATVRYESAEEEGRVILKDGWVCPGFADCETPLVFDVLSDYFTSSNEAPLKKALVGAGLCDDVEMGVSCMGQVTILVTIRNTTPDKVETCRRVVRETFEQACRDGLDRTRLTALLDNQEFHRLEMDTGMQPKGLVLMNAAMGRWIHGADPLEVFRFRDLFAGVRAKLERNFFEERLATCVLKNRHHGELTLVPSKTLGAERAQAEAEAMAAVRAGLSDDAYAQLAEDARALRARQSTPERPEDLATLPQLKVADVPLAGRETPCPAETVDGVTVLRPDVDAEGLFHLRLSFALEGLSDAELQDAKFLATLLGQLATARRSAVDLGTALDGTCGRFGVDVSSHLRGTWLTVSVSALDRRQAEVVRLLGEILRETRFDDAKAVDDLRAQARERLLRAVSRNGDSFAMRRAVRGFSETARRTELLDGIAQLRRLQMPVTTDFAALARKIFVRDRLTVFLTRGAPDELLAPLLATFPKAAESLAAAPAPTPATPATAEGLEIPGNIAFSALAGHLPDGHRQRGAHFVAARIVTLDHLWNAVRVKGGAYSTGLFVSTSGNVVFRSYRDPHPEASVNAFRASGAALRAFVRSGAPLEKYQVASIGRIDPYRSPQAEVDYLQDQYFAGLTAEDRARIRREILTVTPEDLLAVADELDAAAARAMHCVVGGKAILAACALEKTEAVAR